MPFFCHSDDVSKAVAKAIESLCQDMTDGVVQKFSFDSQFLSVDTDAPTMKVDTKPCMFPACADCFPEWIELNRQLI